MTSHALRLARRLARPPSREKSPDFRYNHPRAKFQYNNRWDKIELPNDYAQKVIEKQSGEIPGHRQSPAHGGCFRTNVRADYMVP